MPFNFPNKLGKPYKGNYFIITHKHKCVTLYPSCWPASPVKSVSAARGQSQAAGPWPEHGTPRRGSRPARSPALDSDSNFYFPLTSDLQPGGEIKRNGPQIRNSSCERQEQSPVYHRTQAQKPGQQPASRLHRSPIK